jgi:hypothetical protein
VPPPPPPRAPSQASTIAYTAASGDDHGPSTSKQLPEATGKIAGVKRKLSKRKVFFKPFQKLPKIFVPFKKAKKIILIFCIISFPKAF